MDEEMMMQQPEEMGRGTDSVMAHLSLGEIVIPRAFQDDPEFLAMLQQYFQAQGVDINEFTVGHEANKINPETGYPEFFLKKLFKSKLFRTLAPLALSVFAPGVGTAIGSSILGAGAAGSATLGNALLGAGVGAATGGGLKGAALGGLAGGIGANLGSLPGSTLASTTGQSALQGATQGSGILGSIGNATGLSAGQIPKMLGGLTSGSSFNALGGLASAIGGGADDAALKKAQKQLLAGNEQQLANINSYNAGEYLNDPEYQYTQQQGEQALNRSLGAQGGIFSGRALQAANEQNKAINTDFQNRYYQKYLNRVGMQNPLYAGNANIKAQTGISRAGNFGTTLASILNPQKTYSLEELMKLGVA